MPGPRPALPFVRRLGALVAALALVALPACRVTDVPLWHASGPPTPEDCAIERVLGVVYHDGVDEDAVRHRLDLFLPRGRPGFPVVVLFHGGAWTTGDNRCCGLYSSVGEYLASRGIGVVIPNYRLSPTVRHPEHVRDAARAFAWVRDHIGQYGGRADRLFLAGHSAGGHIAALLATDEQYLRARGLSAADVRGVIALSGVYEIPPGKFDLTLGGTSARAFHWSCLLPLRGGPGPMPLPLPGLPLRLNVFGPAFGDDPAVRADAAPINHVRAGLPPFLIVSAERDLPTLPRMAAEFQRALEAKGCDARLIHATDRNHNSVMFCAIADDDPVARAIRAFIAQHSDERPVDEPRTRE